MKSFLRALVLTVLFLAPLIRVAADGRSSIGDVVKAQMIINQVLTIVDKYREFTVQLQAPAPAANNAGKYLLPYKASGEMTEWAGKALNAQAGAMVGEKAGSAASSAIASKVPFGGLLAGAAKKKGKELGAVTAIGGEEYIKKTSELSFNTLEEYAVYLHVNHAGDANYKEVLATTMAIYPDLEGRFDGAIKAAYSQAAKTPKKTG